jgi:hypothetical protein
MMETEVAMKSRTRWILGAIGVVWLLILIVLVVNDPHVTGGWFEYLGFSLLIGGIGAGLWFSSWEGEIVKLTVKSSPVKDSDGFTTTLHELKAVIQRPGGKEKTVSLGTYRFGEPEPEKLKVNVGDVIRKRRGQMDWERVAPGG